MNDHLHSAWIMLATGALFVAGSNSVVSSALPDAWRGVGALAAMGLGWALVALAAYRFYRHYRG